MKITVHGGHAYPGKGASGAVGYINESIQDRIVKDKVIAWLQKDGHSVVDATVDSGTQSQVLNGIVSICNKANADVNASIHFNSGGGNGTETLIKTGNNTMRDIATRINNNIVALGFRNRGVKTASDLYFLNKVSKSLLVECCFVDSKSDFNLYNADKMAKAIADGIVGHSIQDPQPPKPKHTAESIDLSKYANVGNPVFRLYNRNTSDHFFTVNIIESDILIDAGWSLEGVSWVEPVGEGHIPVHRLYNPNNGDHHYTLADNECSFLSRNGWAYEGIAFYSDKDQHIPVYRLYNPNQASAGSHFYTISDAEKQSLEKAGWITEGIGWYGVAI